MTAPEKVGISGAKFDRYAPILARISTDSPVLRRGCGPSDRRAVADLPVEAQITGMLVPYRRLTGIKSVRSIDDRRQGLVLNRDLLGGVARRGGGFGDDHRDRVPDMAYPVA